MTKDYEILVLILQVNITINNKKEEIKLQTTTKEPRKGFVKQRAKDM